MCIFTSNSLKILFEGVGLGGIKVLLLKMSNFNLHLK